MLNRSFLFVLSVLSVFASSCALAAEHPKHVFVISLDGGKPAVMLESKMPVLFKKVEDGAHSWEAQTVLPSITLVSHTSMVTGVGPDKHLVDWNSWVPEKGQVKVPTMFSLAKEAGFSTALFAAKEKFIYLNTPGAIDAFGVIEAPAQVVARIAASYIEDQKPALCFIHFADSDSKGHKYGWGSDEQKQAFADEDEGLNTIVEAIHDAGIEEESVVIVTADHGGHGKSHGGGTPEDVTIPWVAWGKGVKKGFTISVPVSTCDTAATALWLLGVSVPEDWAGKPVTAAFEE